MLPFFLTYMNNRKYIRLFEAFDTNQINAALGFLENNQAGIIQKYGDKSHRVAKAILVDLRDNGDKQRNYSVVPDIGKADEVYKRALDVAIKIQSANPTSYGQLSGIGSNISTYFEREVDGQKFIIGTKKEDK